MIKTPIYLDFDLETTYLNSNELNINIEDPINLYLSVDTVMPPYEEIKFILAPRYYIKIISPKNQNLSTIKIHIHKSSASLLKNKARVLLTPSISYGINSSYKIEYWEWIPTIGYTNDLTHKKVREEYWYIPTLNEFYEPELPFKEYHQEFPTFYKQTRLVTEAITVERSIDTINNKCFDIIPSNKNYIFAFNNYVSFKESVENEVLLFNEETLKWTFSKKLTSSILERNLSEVDGDKMNGITTTNIEYVMPFNSSQLILNEF